MRLSCLQSPLRTLVFTALLYLFAPSPTHAQAPYLFASVPGGATSQIAGYSVALDGMLTPVQGSPFNVSGEGGFVTTDPTDQFLFVLNAHSNTISVLSIDSNGALTEVSGSPVPAPTPPPGNGSAPAAPIGMATFKGASANYLYVAYRNGPQPFTGAIVAFQIGTPSQAPPLSPISTMTFEAAPVDMAIAPQGYLYLAFQLVPGSILGNQSPGIAVLPIDTTSGQLGQPTFFNSSLHEDSLGLNPAATVLFDGEGTSAAGLLESSQIRSDGTTLGPRSLPVVSPNSPPSTLLADGSGQLLYVQQGAQAAVYTIDRITGALSAPSTSAAPVPFNLSRGTAAAHPVVPYLFNLQSGQIHIFEITDFTSGALRELVSSPVTIVEGAGSLGLVLTHNAIGQTAPQDAAQLVPAAINFDDTTIGQSVSDSSALLTNTGTDALNATVTITGADQGDFSTTTCASPLAARTSCRITVTFTPTLAGARQATLVAADSAGPQTLQLTGNGIASGSGSGSGGTGGGGSGSGGSGGSGGGSGSGDGGGGSAGSGGSGGSGGQNQPTISIAPSSPTFLAPAVGVATPPQYVTLTNSSSNSLQISGVQITGQNAADFSLLAPCPKSTYTANEACSIQIVFTPSGPGTRLASLIVTDNASNSPQPVTLVGSTQAEPLKILPVNSDSLAQIVTAGQTAKFQLQLSATFDGTVTFACSGLPANATCSFNPSPIPVTSVQPSPFSVNVATVEGSSSMNMLGDRHKPQISPERFLLLTLLIVYASLLHFFGRGAALRIRPLTVRSLSLHPFSITSNAAILAVLTFSLLTFAGCGGASTVTTAPAITPTPTATSQTYTITITPSATTSNNTVIPAIQPIQLTLILD